MPVLVLEEKEGRDEEAGTFPNGLKLVEKPEHTNLEPADKMVMKKANKLAIILGIVLILVIVAIIAYSPVFKTGTLKVKYVSGITHNGQYMDGIDHGGNILIYIDGSTKGVHPADQYITFDWVPAGKHSITIYKIQTGNDTLLATNDATVNVLATTTIDLQYWDGFF